MGRHFVSAKIYELQLGLFDVYFDLCPCVFVCLFVVLYVDGTHVISRGRFDGDVPDSPEGVYQLLQGTGGQLWQQCL